MKVWEKTRNGKDGYLRAKASGEYRARYQRYSGRSHDEIEESGILVIISISMLRKQMKRGSCMKRILQK